MLDDENSRWRQRTVVKKRPAFRIGGIKNRAQISSGDHHQALTTAVDVAPEIRMSSIEFAAHIDVLRAYAGEDECHRAVARIESRPCCRVGRIQLGDGVALVAAHRGPA